MDGHYRIISWFTRLNVLVRDGIVSFAPLWADYLIGWSFGELVEVLRSESLHFGGSD